MHARWIVFVPPAAVVTGSLFFLSSAISSTLEARLRPPPEPSTFALVRYETECERLSRRIEELAWEATTCEVHPGCLGVPSLCPIVMSAALESEYQQLQDAMLARCAGQPTYARRSESGCPSGLHGCRGAT